MNNLTFKLPHMKEQWAASLLQGLYTQHPYLIVDSSKVIINDYALNDAELAIVYLTMQGQRFGAPTIIKDGEAYPFDILLLPNGEVELLNRDNYEKILSEIYQVATPAPRTRSTGDLFKVKTSGRLPIDQMMVLDSLTKLSSYNKFLFREYDPAEFLKTAQEVFSAVPPEIKDYAKELNLRQSKLFDTNPNDITEFEIFDKTAGYKFIFYNNGDKVKEFLGGKSELEKVANSFDISDEEIKLMQDTKYAKFKKHASELYIDYETEEKPEISIRKMNGEIEKTANANFLIKPAEPKAGLRMTFAEKDPNGDTIYSEPIYLTKVADDEIEGYSSVGFIKLKETDKHMIKKASIPERKLYLLTANALPFEVVDKKNVNFDEKYQKLIKKASFDKIKIFKGKSNYTINDSKVVKDITDVNEYLMKTAGFAAMDTLYIDNHLENISPLHSISIDYKHKTDEPLEKLANDKFEITKNEKKSFIKFAAYLLKVAADTPEPYSPQHVGFVDDNKDPEQSNFDQSKQEITSRDLLDQALQQNPDDAIANNVLEMSGAKNMSVEELASQFQLLEYTKNALIKLMFQAEVGILPIEYKIVRSALLALESVILRLENTLNQMNI